MVKLYLFLLPALSVILQLSSCTRSQGVGEIEQNKSLSADSTSLKKNGAEKFIFDCAVLKRSALKMDSIILRQTETNVKLANDAIKAFTEFAYHCSSDSVTPIYLIKTAQVAQAINNTTQAKVVLEKCISDYPNFKNRPAAIFLLAQLYDETIYLNNEEEARRLYQKIIDEYPKSDWAASAKGAISFLGKSDQQILEELKRKNK